MNLIPLCRPSAEVISISIKGQNLKPNTMNLTEENIGNRHDLFDKGKEFLNRIP